MLRYDIAILYWNGRASHVIERGAELKMLVVEGRLFHTVMRTLSGAQPSRLNGRLMVNKFLNEVLGAR